MTYLSHSLKLPRDLTDLDLYMSEESKNTREKKLKGIIALAALALILSFITSLGTRYGLAEYEVSQSKTSPWEKSFKSNYISGCIKAINLEFKNQRTPASDIEKLRPYSQNYCECLTNKIENARVIATKYNSLKTSADDYVQQASLQVEEYLSTKKGQFNISFCITQAKKTVNFDHL